ncbi:ralBP1-associated Eps domain-containing protein 2, partial [Apteryx rowi]|uniref:ralBP1-associated Eps domain-containing protein 2 n=1 Tax=Apteryx rowi TaxID=308060 RepID=UPI000E1C60FE
MRLPRPGRRLDSAGSPGPHSQRAVTTPRRARVMDGSPGVTEWVTEGEEEPGFHTSARLFIQKKSSVARPREEVVLPAAGLLLRARTSSRAGQSATEAEVRGRSPHAGNSGAVGGTGTGALFLPLSDSEQQRYSELFARCCPPGAAAALPEAAAGGSSVGELFRASQLPPDTLHQITEVCGAKRVGYFGPAQFYIALKLIAAAQSGFPVRIESIKNELPLPRFMALKNDSEIRYGNPAELHGVKFQVPHATLEKNSYKRTDEGDKQEHKSPPMSPICSPPASPSSYQRTSLSYGYGKSRNGLEQQHGAPYEVRHSTHQQDGPSSGNYGAKSACACSTLNRSLSAEREPLDSSAHYADDPWRITEEQRDYYVNQFRSLQPDLNSFISGSVAKNFFTKSKLPIPELSHIWELSDVDCDGALTLAEFCAAFHLVVARKNGYQLPETLPETLLPDYLQAASLKPLHDCTLFDSYSESLPGNQQTRDFNRTE